MEMTSFHPVRGTEVKKARHRILGIFAVSTTWKHRFKQYEALPDIERNEWRCLATTLYSDMGPPFIGNTACDECESDSYVRVKNDTGHTLFKCVKPLAKVSSSYVYEFPGRLCLGT